MDVRLTAPDGYRGAAQLFDRLRAGAAANTLELAVERLDGGEVSASFTRGRGRRRDRTARPDRRPFRLAVDDGGPVLMIGGGSGVVPFVSMVRHRALVGSTAAMLLLFSARTATT